MMNGAGQGSMPMHPGRGGQHDIPYSPQHHGPYPPQSYNPHPQHFRQPYYQQPPQQWAYYPNMQPMYRPYPHQHPAMMASPYPMPQIPQSMSPRPGQNIPQHLPPRPPPTIYSPPPPERPLHQLQPSNTLITPPNPIQVSQRRIPWYPPLPWYSDSTTPFPPAARKKRRTFAPQSPSLPVELPRRNTITKADPGSNSPEFQESHMRELSIESTTDNFVPPPQDVVTLVDTLPGSLEHVNTETPTTSQAPSENNSTQPTTPSSTQPPRSAGSTTTVRPVGKLLPVVPVIPHIPGLSKSQRKESVSTVDERASSVTRSDRGTISTIEGVNPDTTDAQSADKEAADLDQTVPATAPKSPPKSWADLLKSGSLQAQRHSAANTKIDSAQANGLPSTVQLAEVLENFSLSAGDDTRASFIKPRGLKNTGNMCYMNSILQVLLYCTPFFSLLDSVGRQAAQSFRNDTPMIEAMIWFIREFPIIDAAKNTEQLRMRLKPAELEQYGTPFTPEFVYEAIRRLPRFSSMRRGHQQDAEEFLGFLLEELHEECGKAMKKTNKHASEGTPSDDTQTTQPDGGWLEVGPKQRAATTQSSGQVSLDSPITKIFGGTLRSEFRVPGTKPSVTLEPYQSLQLDIGSPRISNIVDALKGLTRSEIIHGDFNSPRGPGVNAMKQVFIETLPPVLILHLKRFQYENTGGTQKIWKNVGYPQELEIPKEVFPQHKRAGFATRGGLPRYRLISVVYHHGKSASNGHYTVDVRRQDDQEWIRLDDTVIQRVRSEDVADPGRELQPKVLAAALEQHKRDQSSSSNMFDTVKDEQDGAKEVSKGWSQVNGSGHGRSRSKVWSGVANDSSTQQSSRSTSTSSSKRTPTTATAVKENKVAYILFYQRI